MHPSGSSRKYTDDEKRQLLANLDLEVAHRCRQLEAILQDHLENFTIHQEGQVSRIPKQVRTMTMREFGEKYNGDTQLALRGYQKDRLAAAGADANFGDIDKSMRKRKFLENHEVEKPAARESDSRPLKAAKTIPGTPNKMKKPQPSGSAQHGSRFIRSSSKPPSMGIPRPLSRLAGTPSPEKPRPPFNSSMSYNARAPSRPTSPMKPPTTSRVPSASKFNPTLPAKTPTYPPSDDSTTLVRLPRKDENMLSVNGSPLANPYQFGLGWFKGVEQASEDAEDEEDTDQPSTSRGLKRSKSSIVIRRDPSSTLHSRQASQASLFTSTSQSTSSHTRDPSQATRPAQQSGLNSAFRFPPPPPPSGNDTTPRQTSKHTRSFSAMVAIPTKDGHLLEFDPLQTSPGALDALEGITASAKKQARIEMGRLVQAAVDKWKI
ncbi:hypothetical protein D9611_008748 [Ephemerocybe angulata]|uniref:Borealin N-terminal domain-containing protein n=1 Tax=Ephemerocybe angulata TaxID=980116 RepID=A0A8H5CC22_9AGAR|nr:hypothetical protein D9611_008748 [Tulosesus angulatus]